MNITVDVDDFRRRMDNFAPDHHARGRIMAMYSAAIALADDAAMTAAVQVGRRYGLGRDCFYEMVLQSYLFLGFPRMLTAAEHLAGQYKEQVGNVSLDAVSADEAAEWFERGLALCRRVYGDNYDRLRDRVMNMAPEVFRWMVFEGYGKVLSRPGVDPVERELAVVACLMMENRPKQLFSHVKGALNVGAEPELLRQVIDDVGPSAGDGYQSCLTIAARLDLL
jgi:4-carboxymuconolactone decarboxylase